MARKKRQGGTRRPSATEEVESVSDAKELVIGRSDLNQCVHYACKSTELKRILERIKSSLRKDFRCEVCNEKVIPPMKRKVAFSESTLRWACLDCERAFCGGLNNFGPNGDIVIHATFSGHTLCTLLDMLSLSWCFECGQQNTTGEEEEEEEDEGVELAMDVEEEAKEMIQQEVYNPNFCDHFTITELKQKLERIKPSSRCQTCGEEVKMDPGKPPKKRKEAPSDSTLLWVCFDCEKTFCGDMGVFGPNGHINDHAASDCHQLCARLDMPSKVWCYICNDEFDSATGVKGEQKGTKQQEIDNAVSESRTGFVVKKLPNTESNCYFNSVLQNLFAMERLRQHLASLDQPGGNVTKELKRHFAESCDDSIETLNPLELRKLLRKKDEFLPGIQEDSHELLIHLLEKLESEEKEFVNELFQGELFSDVHCTRCGNISRKSDGLGVLSLELPMDNVAPAKVGHSHELITHLLEELESEENEFVNELFQEELFSDMHSTWFGNIFRNSDCLGVLSFELPEDNAPPAREKYRDQVKGTVRKTLIDELDEGNESDNPQTSSNYPEGSESYDSLGYNLPGASDYSGAAPDSDLATLAELTGKRRGSQHRNSSNGKVDMNRCKEDSNESIMVSDHKIPIGKDVDTDIGVVKSDVCEADNMNGLSIERCLDLYTKSENMPDASCNSCSPESQRQQKPSERTDMQEDGVKSGSKKASDSPSDISDQKNVGLDGHNLAAAPRSSQDDPETKLVKATKRLLIKRPPLILVIHLKRSTRESGITGKKEDHVIFKEKLDLTPYVDHSYGKDEQHIYHLTGVVVHEGSSTMAGHYFAYVRRKTSQGGTAWFKADDDKIPEEVPMETVLGSEAYMLFFERDDDTL